MIRRSRDLVTRKDSTRNKDSWTNARGARITTAFTARSRKPRTGISRSLFFRPTSVAAPADGGGGGGGVLHSRRMAYERIPCFLSVSVGLSVIPVTRA